MTLTPKYIIYFKMEKIPKEKQAPSYAFWAIIFDKDGNKIGYTHTQKEADDICGINPDVSWEDISDVIPDEEEQKQVYIELNQLTINDFKKKL